MRAAMGSVWIAVLLGAVACDPVYGVEGTVQDPSGAPIAGATVAMTCPSGRTEHARADAAGHFSFGGVGGAFEAARCSLVVDAPGFVPRTLRTFDVCYQNTEDHVHRSWPCKPGMGTVRLNR